MRRFIFTLITLVAICVAFFFALSMPRGMGGYYATGGVLDLTYADFTSTRHNLDGEWEFFYGQLLQPDDFFVGTVPHGTLINVPGSWHNVGYPLHGYATYRLTIKTNEPSLMLLLPHIPSASTVWINGQKAFEAGITGEATPQAIGGRNAFIPFYPLAGQVEVVIQASNYAWFVSGLNFSIEIGVPSLLLNDAMARRILLGVFIGVLIAMFMYQFIMFVHSRKDKEWVYIAFALYCIMTALRFAMETNGFLLLFGNYGHVERSIFQVVMSLKVVGLVAFTHLVFEMPISKVRRIIYAVTLGVPILTAVFLPFGTVDSRIVFIPLIPLMMIFVSTLCSKRLHENYYNYLFLIALGIFAVAQPIQRFTPIEHYLYMPAVAHNLFMVLAQFFMLSMSYAQAKEAEKRLSEENAALDSLSRIKSEYMANLTHETKTPLTVISTQVQQAREIFETIANHITNGTTFEAIVNSDEWKADSNAILESLDIAQDETMRLSHFADNALWLAATQESKAQKKLDMVLFLTKCGEAYRTVIEKQGNTLYINTLDNLPYVLGESSRLVHVMENLLTNANNHTKNGTISVDAKAKCMFVEVTIKDNGTGIDPELLPHVFLRGVTGGGGTGMGLPISKNIVESHGGKIDIASEPGKGTTVTFTIPVYTDNNDTDRAVNTDA
ncbi:MAG: ATP-binding protein [Defluviitaleaceae bacterium]|nr:ATP-binding protein [Defluviitaleaceae bacterium]